MSLNVPREQLQDSDDEAFRILRAALHQRTGIFLSDSKQDLMQGRLRARLSELGMSSLSDYAKLIRKEPRESQEWQAFINCLTTNKTDFFRESSHFDFLLKTCLPKLLPSRKMIRLWSAASSTGEEAYTLAMILKEAQLKNPNFDYRIEASDIDTDVLERARRGLYLKSRLDEVPQPYHRIGFLHGTGEIAKWIQVKRELKDHVNFRQCNLLSDNFPFEHRFDIVFCRNVLIYFKVDTIQQVLGNIAKQVNPGGWLFLGHSETIHELGGDWDYVQPSVYQRR